jgi:excisionase family DNA binding protein
MDICGTCRGTRNPGHQTNNDGQVLLTVKEAAKLLRISRNLAYELVAQGRLPSIYLGRRILIPRHGLERWIVQEAGLPEPSPAVVSSAPQRH